MKRELEFISEAKSSQSHKMSINERRGKWMLLCNSHEASELVGQLYAVDAVYYNHKPTIIGHEHIIEEYQYMNQEDYHLTLDPILVEIVNDELVFEIGQCSGTYNGKYMLVWQKDKFGDWDIILDSNI